MKTLVALVAMAGMLMSPTGAGAFDVRSPSPDVELREQSERLHTSAGDAMASASRRPVRVAPIGQGSRAQTFTRDRLDPRERALRGHDD